MRKYMLCLGVLAMVSSVALAGNSVVHIAPLPEHNYSSGRCMTPDGAYVGGTCYGGPWPNDIAGFVWDEVNGSRQPMSFGAPYNHSWPEWSNGIPQLEVSGISYRDPSDGSAQELIVHGRLDDPVRWDQARRRRHAMNYSTDGGLTWSVFIRNKWPGSKDGVYVPRANSLAGSGEYAYAVPYLPHDYDKKYPRVFIDRKSGGAGGDYLCVNQYRHKYDSFDGRNREGMGRAVSATGVAVGCYRNPSNGNQMENMMWSYDDSCPRWLGAPTYFVGLDAPNYTGEPYDISDDNSVVVGLSPVNDGRLGKFPYAYDVASDVTTELPSLPGMTVLNVAYGVDADGTWAVGACASAFETKAVLWNLDDGRLIDLSQYFADLGLMDDWYFFYRAYAVGVKDNGEVVVTGEGYTKDVELHAFVATLCVDPTVLEMDILPEDDPNLFTPNKKGRGRLPIEIYGTESFDVADIDLDSIMVAGAVSSVKTETGIDYNGDGYLDLKIHIARRDLIDALALDTEIGNVVEITVEAKTLDLCDVIASDVIEVIPLAD